MSLFVISDPPGSDRYNRSHFSKFGAKPEINITSPFTLSLSSSISVSFYQFFCLFLSVFLSLSTSISVSFFFTVSFSVYFRFCSKSQQPISDDIRCSDHSLEDHYLLCHTSATVPAVVNLFANRKKAYFTSSPLRKEAATATIPLSLYSYG